MDIQYQNAHLSTCRELFKLLKPYERVILFETFHVETKRDSMKNKQCQSKYSREKRNECHKDHYQKNNFHLSESGALYVFLSSGTKIGNSPENFRSMDIFVCKQPDRSKYYFPFGNARSDLGLKPLAISLGMSQWTLLKEYFIGAIQFGNPRYQQETVTNHITFYETFQLDKVHISAVVFFPYYFVLIIKTQWEQFSEYF